MKSFSYVIREQVGIHARPAKKLVDIARQYDSQIELYRGQQSADLKRILSLMTLGVKQGEAITVKVEGADEGLASEALEAFFRQSL